MEADFARNAAFYDKVAAQYDMRMSRKPSDILAREAFVDLVATCVSPGSTLLDFGCGTGLDAVAYEQQGYRVLAYDNSPGMMAELERRCQTGIASGRITTCSVGYPSFLDRLPQSPTFHAVVSDFAVLNLIQDLEPLFESFAQRLAPPGWIIVSILNPLHWMRLTTPHWWRSLLADRTQPPINRTRPYITYLHFVPALLRAAHQFYLVGSANAGSFVRYDTVTPEETHRLWWGNAGSNAMRVRRLLWETPAHKMLGRFMFLVLRRDP